MIPKKLIDHINLMGVCSTPPPRLQLLHGSPTDQGAGALAWLRGGGSRGGPHAGPTSYFLLAIIIYILLFKNIKSGPLSLRERGLPPLSLFTPFPLPIWPFPPFISPSHPTTTRVVVGWKGGGLTHKEMGGEWR
uniref:Uncharacterized protein n=1 Tax=Morchella brunnea TaxID=1174671 RepID=A0A8K1I7S6_9PEZI|nr:hypothetical protein LK370_mgp205 [Morchella brunnea]UBU98498.1 hypothetical protein [Morchella brunnea]